MNKKTNSEETNNDWKKEYLKDWWGEFVEKLPFNKDLTLRVFGIKMIDEPLTPENLIKHLQRLKPSELKLVQDDDYYFDKIKSNQEKILKNQEEITFEQFDELQKIFRNYKETGVW